MNNSKKVYTLALTSRYQNNQYFVKESYINWLKNDFNIEIIVPTSNNYSCIAQRCDALIILGGEDIHPTLYDQTLHYYTHLEDKSIEDMDFRLIEYFYNHKKPILI